jgi:hypothetical protein
MTLAWDNQASRIEWDLVLSMVQDISVWRVSIGALRNHANNERKLEFEPRGISEQSESPEMKAILLNGL